MSLPEIKVKVPHFEPLSSKYQRRRQITLGGGGAGLNSFDREFSLHSLRERINTSSSKDEQSCSTIGGAKVSFRNPISIYNSIDQFENDQNQISFSTIRKIRQNQRYISLNNVSEKDIKVLSNKMLEKRNKVIFQSMQ